MLLGKYDGQILAVDFDDTIAFTRFPEILEPNYKVIRFVKLFKSEGGRTILYTCRHDKELEEAVEFCSSMGLEFDKVNENFDEEIKKFGDSRKIFAHYYLDDKAMKISDITESVWGNI